MKKYLTPFLIGLTSLSPLFLSAQTLVNRQFIDTIGHLPAVFSNVVGMRDTNNTFLGGGKLFR